ncbi:MAG: hypothetical protein ACLPV4_21225 [Solirubrobacteraceae bacterium]
MTVPVVTKEELDAKALAWRQGQAEALRQENQRLRARWEGQERGRVERHAADQRAASAAKAAELEGRRRREHDAEAERQRAWAVKRDELTAAVADGHAMRAIVYSGSVDKLTFEQSQALLVAVHRVAVDWLVDDREQQLAAHKARR